jgi:hypothetical protein
MPKSVLQELCTSPIRCTFATTSHPANLTDLAPEPKTRHHCLPPKMATFQNQLHRLLPQMPTIQIPTTQLIHDLGLLRRSLLLIDLLINFSIGVFIFATWTSHGKSIILLCLGNLALLVGLPGLPLFVRYYVQQRKLVAWRAAAAESWIEMQAMHGHLQASERVREARALGTPRGCAVAGT